MLDQKQKNGPPTIEEKVKFNSRLIRQWEEANPGLLWESPDYREGNNIYITKEMLDSPAYRSLSRAAMLIYQDFLSKRVMKKIKRNRQKTWAIQNNGEIMYPYSEAVEKGFTRATFRDAIDELQIKGFIDIKHLGKGGRKPAKGTGDITKFWIDNRWAEFDLKTQKSVVPPRKPRRKETRQNRGFQSIWADKKKAAAMLAKRKKIIFSIHLNTS